MGRPSTPKLSRELIASTALELVDETGRFSIPELARRLEVSGSSLYKHVRGREEILELVRDKIHEESPAIDVSAPWQHTVRQVAHFYRNVWAKHPFFVPMIAMSTLHEDAHGMDGIKDFATALTSAGFQPDETLMIIVSVDVLAFGGALDAGAPDDIYPPTAREYADALGGALRSIPPHERADRAFEFAVEALVSSLEARLSAR